MSREQSSEMDNLRESATETIYLVPDREEGQLYYCWCDDPAPSLGMDASEAVEYVRRDVHGAALEREQALAAHVHELRSELRDRAVQAWCGCEHPACKRCRDDEDTERVLSIKPDASLAHHDLIKQAEALEKLAADSFVFDADELRDRASDLRQRAQALK